MKNLKIYKNIGLIAGGITLASVFSYNLCTNGLNVRPFEHNEYELHKVTIQEYTEDGMQTNSYYGNDNDVDYIVITEPYKNSIGNYLSTTYKKAVKGLNKEQIDFLIRNISDQELLLKQEYIQTVIDKANSGNSEMSFQKSDTLPKENNYKIGYIDVTLDKNDIKKVSSEKFDAFATFYFLLMTGLVSFTEFAFYLSVKNACKDEITVKKLKK